MLLSLDLLGNTKLSHNKMPHDEATAKLVAQCQKDNNSKEKCGVWNAVKAINARLSLSMNCFLVEISILHLSGIWVSQIMLMMKPYSALNFIAPNISSNVWNLLGRWTVIMAV